MFTGLDLVACGGQLAQNLTLTLVFKGNFLKRYLASEARQAVGRAPVVKYGWEAWACGQPAGLSKAKPACPC